jgi:N-hydroxyarylamine O-acetyltransferase
VLCDWGFGALGFGPKLIMEDVSFLLDDYLERISFSGLVEPTEDRLETLHRAQVYTIPFENFDILLGRGVSLDPAKLFDKLVRHARGGYCFELNGLMLSALHAFGFEARPLLARVHLAGPPSGRDHQLALVNVNGKEWIADVGFGGQSLRAAIPFELNREAKQDGRTYRLVEAARFGTMLQWLADGEWRDLYSFDLGYVFPNDIEYGNHFTSTHPRSFFTYTRMAAMARPDGLVSLHDLTLSVTTPTGKDAQELTEGQPYLDALKANFGIELGAPYEAIRPLPPPPAR